MLAAAAPYVAAGGVGAAAGILGGMRLDQYWEDMTGESLSDRIGDWLGDLIAPVMTPEQIDEMIVPASCDPMILLGYDDPFEKAKRKLKEKKDPIPKPAPLDDPNQPDTPEEIIKKNKKFPDDLGPESPGPIPGL